MIVSLVFAVAACGPPPATLSAAGEHAASADAAPEQRALAFLTREVPQWHREHACFSCHNNGDAARALYRLRTLGHRLPDEVLADTTAWLARPEGWKDNHGDERFSDKTLANIQFAAALAAAQEARAIDDRQALVRAAELLVRDQQNDGTWHVDAGGAIGSPITWGRFLSAALCRDVLVRAGRRRFAGPIDRIDGFLRREAPRTVLDAAGGLLGLAEADDAAAIRQRQTCLKIIGSAAAEDGGWGPYRNAPLEVFDTAVVVLALERIPNSGRSADAGVWIARGRRYLARTQLADGSWPATTRPPDRESYAHRVSTTAWATMALLATSAAAGER